MIEEALHFACEGGGAVSLDFELVIKRTARKKSIGIRVFPNRVVLSAPVWTSDRQLHALVRERSAWIQDKLQAISSVIAPVPLSLQGGTWPVQGVWVPIEVATGSREVSKSASGWRIQVPSPDEASIANAWDRHLKQLAVQHLTDRVDYFANRLGVQPSALKFRRYSARWGSCSASGSVTLHWPIIQAPDWVSDYLVVHELSHLHHFNHSPAFWACVESMMPNWRAARTWLRDEGRWMLETNP